jgi:diguanylate cyclase (GGDEF)-like protein
VLEDLAAAMMAEIELRLANRQVAAAAAELHFAATHDSLTRVGNRRALMEDLGGLLAEKRTATFALLDVHGMRQVNDHFGIAAGDALLTTLARRLETALVGDAHVYRLGGMQLCALLAETGTAVERIVSAACGALSSTEHAVGCRASTVELPREARSVASVLRLADARLARYGHVATARA